MIVPFAVWRPLHPENEDAPRTTPRLLIVHTMVGTLKGVEANFDSESNPLESQFGIGCPLCGPELDGVIWQWMDTEREADANYLANSIAISVETCDHADPNRPWSPKQLDAIERLCRWANAEHGIPLKLAPVWDGWGLGWHVMFGAPGKWTPVAKSCPGAVRIAQFKDIILPRLQNPEGVIVTPEDKTYFDNQFKLVRVGDMPGGTADSHDFSSNEGLGRKVQAVDDRVARVEAAVAALAPGSATIDYDLLSDKVADKLALRLAS